jgi:hypothetical protein
MCSEHVAIPIAESILHIGDGCAVLRIDAGFEEVAIRRFDVYEARIAEDGGHLRLFGLREGNGWKQHQEKSGGFVQIHVDTSDQFAVKFTLKPACQGKWQPRRECSLAEGAVSWGRRIQPEKDIYNRSNRRGLKRNGGQKQAGDRSGDG